MNLSLALQSALQLHCTAHPQNLNSFETSYMRTRRSYRTYMHMRCECNAMLTDGGCILDVVVLAFMMRRFEL